MILSLPIPIPAGVTELPVPLKKNPEGRYEIADDDALAMMRMMIGPMLDTLKAALDPTATESEADSLTGALVQVLPEEREALQKDAEASAFPLVLSIRFQSEAEIFTGYSGLYLFAGALKKWLNQRTNQKL